MARLIPGQQSRLTYMDPWDLFKVSEMTLLPEKQKQEQLDPFTVGILSGAMRPRVGLGIGEGDQIGIGEPQGEGGGGEGQQGEPTNGVLDPTPSQPSPGPLDPTVPAQPSPTIPAPSPGPYVPVPEGPLPEYKRPIDSIEEVMAPPTTEGIPDANDPIFEINPDTGIPQWVLDALRRREEGIAADEAASNIPLPTPSPSQQPQEEAPWEGPYEEPSLDEIASEFEEPLPGSPSPVGPGVGTSGPVWPGAPETATGEAKGDATTLPPGAIDAIWQTIYGAEGAQGELDDGFMQEYGPDLNKLLFGSGAPISVGDVATPIGWSTVFNSAFNMLTGNAPATGGLLGGLGGFVGNFTPLGPIGGALIGSAIDNLIGENFDDKRVKVGVWTGGDAESIGGYDHMTTGASGLPIAQITRRADSVNARDVASNMYDSFIQADQALFDLVSGMGHNVDLSGGITNADPRHHEQGDNYFGSFAKGEVIGDSINSAPDQFVAGWLSEAGSQVGGDDGAYMEALSRSGIGATQMMNAMNAYAAATPEGKAAAMANLPQPQRQPQPGDLDYPGRLGNAYTQSERWL